MRGGSSLVELFYDVLRRFGDGEWELPEQGVHCLEIYAPFSSKKNLDAVVSEVTPRKSGAVASSSGTRQSPRDALQAKASPFLNRSLRRALLSSPTRADRSGAEGGEVLNAGESEGLNGADDGGSQFKSSRSARASTLDYMTQIFLWRRNKINRLLNLLGRPCDPMPSVFVYGPAATGKISIVRETIRILRRSHAYVSCRSRHTPRLMFESILKQLLDHVRSAKKNFLSAVLKTFSRACRRITELSRSLEPLYQKYCEPVLRGAATTPDDEGKRQRYSMLQPYIRPALSQILIISTPGPKRNTVGQSGGNRGRIKTTPRRILPSANDSQLLSFEMPQCSKYLLLAAHIASRNAATLDASLFDAGDGTRGNSRKRGKVPRQPWKGKRLRHMSSK